MRLTVRNVTDEPVAEVPLLLYRLLAVSRISDGADRPLRFEQRVVGFADAPRLQVNHVRVTLDRALAPGEDAALEIAYGGWLAGYVETGMLYVKDRVAEEFTILRPDAFAYPVPGYPSWASVRATGLPTYDYEARITVPAGQVVANGGSQVARIEHDDRVTWVYRNIRPAWRMDFAVAPYGVLEKAGLRAYYLPGDSAGAAALLEKAGRARALYTEWFGPLEHAGEFAVIEVPDGFGSQADVTSILQTAPAFRDPARHDELYHEVAHLWHLFGGPGEPRWEEGLAVFLQTLTQDALDGTAHRDSAMAAHIDWALRWFAERPEWAATPMAQYGAAGLTGLSYRVGAMMFDVLHRVVGKERFNRIVGGYYRAYRSGGASTDAFVHYASRAAGHDLAPLFDDWLFTTRWYDLLRAGLTADALADRYR